MSFDFTSAAHTAAASLLGDRVALSIMTEAALACIDAASSESEAVAQFTSWADSIAVLFCSAKGLKVEPQKKASRLSPAMSAAKKAGGKGQSLYQYAYWLSRAMVERPDLLTCDVTARKLQNAFATAEPAQRAPRGGQAPQGDQQQQQQQQQQSAKPATLGDLLEAVYNAAALGQFTAGHVTQLQATAKTLGYTMVKKADIIDPAPAALLA